MFDLSLPKLLVLAVIALVIFGPSELPKIASQAGRALRDLDATLAGSGTTSPVRRSAESRPETGAGGHLREL